MEPTLPHLPPQSPRSATKSWLSVLTGRSSASYSVTPSRTTRPQRSSLKLGRKDKENHLDVDDQSIVRSKSYTPFRPPKSTGVVETLQVVPRSRGFLPSESWLLALPDVSLSKSLPSSPSPSRSSSGSCPSSGLIEGSSVSNHWDEDFDSSYSSGGKECPVILNFREGQTDTMSESRLRGGRSCRSLPNEIPESGIEESGIRKSGIEDWILCTMKRPTKDKRINDQIKDRKLLRDPSASKTDRLSKSRNSFRFGKNKNSSGSRASASSTGKTIAVRGHSNVEDLEKKQTDLRRCLDYYEKAIDTKKPELFAGSATMILESVIHLSRDVDQMIPNPNSSEVCSLVSRMNQSVADLVLWNDQFYLYGDDSHNTQSKTSIVNNVLQAVKALVEFAINKENLNMSDAFFDNATSSSPSNVHNERNGSLCSENSPRAIKKLNKTRNSLIHGSMPEIFPAAKVASSNGTFHGSSGVPNLIESSKLHHSISSDSILDVKESSLTNKSPINVGDYDTTAPPIPPKKTPRNRHSSTNDLDSSSSPLPLESPYPLLRASQGSMTPHSPIDSPCPLLRTSQGLMTPHSQRLSQGSMTPHSQVSPATSHDSMIRHPTDSSFLTPIHRISSSSNHSSEDYFSGGRGGGGPYNSSPNSDLTSKVGPSYNSSLNNSDLTSMIANNVGISEIKNWTNDLSFSSPDRSCFLTPSRPSSSVSSSMMMKSSQSFVSQTVVHLSPNDLSSRNVLSASTSSQVLSTTREINTSPSVAHRNSRSSTCSSSSISSGSEVGGSHSISMCVPPPIPKKKGKSLLTNDRTPSQYDNVLLSDSGVSDTLDSPLMVGKCDSRVQGLSATCYSNTSSSGFGSSKSSVTSLDSGGAPSSVSVIHRSHQQTLVFRDTSSADRPPLPIKNNYVKKYMKPVFDYPRLEKECFFDRRSQQITSLYSADHLSGEFQDFDHHTKSYRRSMPAGKMEDVPPALPPKRKSKTSSSGEKNSLGSISSVEGDVVCPCQHLARDLQPPSQRHHHISELEDEEVGTKEPEISRISPSTLSGDEVLLHQEVEQEVEAEVEEETLVDALDVTDEIIFKNGTEDSGVKAGSADALLVYATYCRNGPYLEAFLTTYRTFLTPEQVISKLFYRYHKFICSSNPEHQKAAKNAFSLLVRVVHDLVAPELNEKLLKDLADFEYNLLAKGDLKLGFYFREKLSDKLRLHKEQFKCNNSMNYYTVTVKENPHNPLLYFKVDEIADQMTLLDSELFNKVGLPELLHYSRDQNEDQCPNLKVFAMQINNMSTWVETQILESAPQDREKYYRKFIKIMKQLRKVNNNFNSCIAILSGLESAAVCRLDWHKDSTNVLKDYIDLFGFEKSHRAYRQALADTKPPCIPYLGIILQDLTKLYNVNPNNTKGKVNFLKRWLQFNILEDMKRFIPSNYKLTRNEAIMQFLNNFEDCRSEEALWELSLSIKPQAHRN